MVRRTWRVAFDFFAASAFTAGDFFCFFGAVRAEAPHQVLERHEDGLVAVLVEALPGDRGAALGLHVRHLFHRVDLVLEELRDLRHLVRHAGEEER